GLLAPRAADVETFWRLVVEGAARSDGNAPPAPWDLDRLLGASADFAAFVKGRAGAGIDLPPFDPARFSIPPASVRELDPAVILALLASEQALVDAGFRAGRWDARRVRVVFGQSALRAREADA